MPDAKKTLGDILQETRALLALPGNDFGWSTWDGAATALSEVDHFIHCLENGTIFEPLEPAILFAPTGAIQEVSLSSGWSDKYLAVADRFDSAFAAYAQNKTG